MDYLRERNIDAARNAAADLNAAARLLARHPGAGRPGQMPGTREFSAPHWKKVIVYRVVDDGIIISTLRDTRRLSMPEGD